MPALIAPIGTKLGPCREFCDHPYCQTKRTIASSACRVCRREIGYNRAYVGVAVGALERAYSHADCYQEVASADPESAPTLSDKITDTWETPVNEIPTPIRHELELIRHYARRINELTDQLARNLEKR
jgi:hypothetical protein